MKTMEGLKLRGNTYWTDFYFNGQRIRKSLHTHDLATALERFLVPDEIVVAFHGRLARISSDGC